MARKSKRRGSRPRPQQQTRAARPDLQGGPAAPAGQPSSAAAQPQPAGQRVGGDQALVRAVEMSLAPPQQLPRRGTRQVVLESGDAAIPLDRVPYFTTDLRRVAITGGVMIALLVVSAVTIIPQVVK